MHAGVIRRVVLIQKHYELGRASFNAYLTLVAVTIQ